MQTDTEKLPFLETIYHLRTIEQVILYDKVMQVSAQEEKETIELLRDEYEKEQLGYPFAAPAFEEKAALWASKIVYFASHFLLHRENTNKDLNQYLPEYKGEMTAGEHLSADLCLRFLPQLLQEFRNIDADDVIIPILENHLKRFHYSGIGFKNSSAIIDYDLFKNQCFKQLYLNRITDRKDKELSEIPEINVMLQSNFGNYAKVFWKDFENTNE